MLKLKLHYFGHLMLPIPPDAFQPSGGNNPDAGKGLRQKEKAAASRG